MNPKPEECARLFVDVVPMLMRAMRAEFRRQRRTDLSFTQYQALGFISTHPGASLHNLADHLGLTPPSTSKMVDGLVANGYLNRDPAPDDRRKITLNLTTAGEEALVKALAAMQDHITRSLGALEEKDREQLIRAFQVLRPIFER